MTPTLSASADPSDLERAAAILDDARAENRTGQLIVELAEQDGRSRGLAPERRRAIGEAFLGRFPDVAVTRGTGRIVETVSREGEELIVQADTLYHSFLLIEPPELARLAVLVRDPNVRSVEPEAVHAVAFSAVSPRIPRQSAEVGWHMDSIRAPLEWGTPGTDPVSFATIDTGIQNPWSPPLGTTDIRWNQFVNLTAHNVDDECSEMTSYQDYCYFEHLFHGTGVHSLVNSPQNGQAAVGVNPVPTGTSIALKVAYHDGFQWVVRESDFISAVQWVIDNKTLHYCVISCMDHNIRVVVTSVGYPGDDPSPHSALHNKFDESYFNNDIIAFSAAGDLRGVNTPARFGSVVAVGAVNRSLGLWLPERQRDRVGDAWRGNLDELEPGGSPIRSGIVSARHVGRGAASSRRGAPLLAEK
jgi:hypothetical protein